jgi:hypothetical protein
MKAEEKSGKRAASVHVNIISEYNHKMKRISQTLVSNGCIVKEFYLYTRTFSCNELQLLLCSLILLICNLSILSDVPTV